MVLIKLEIGRAVTRVLLTAFEPYDRWSENSSWLALVDLTGWYDGSIEVTTRRYPVDLTRMSRQLREDLLSDFELAIHLGQSPGAPLIKLETVGLNVRSDGTELIPGAPAAYRSGLELTEPNRMLIDAGIPSEVSHHAGTYLCNAALFLSQHYSQEMNKRTQSMFMHLPLTPSQAAKDNGRLASMSTPMSSAAVAMLMERLSDDLN